MPGAHDRIRKPEDERARGFAVEYGPGRDDPDGGDFSGLWGWDDDGSRVREIDPPGVEVEKPAAAKSAASEEEQRRERMRAVKRPHMPAPRPVPGMGSGPVR